MALSLRLTLGGIKNGRSSREGLVKRALPQPTSTARTRGRDGSRSAPPFSMSFHRRHVFCCRGYVPDDGLRPFVHMNVLDPDQLGAPALEPSMSLHLSGIGPEQSSGRACAGSHLGSGGERTIYLLVQF